MTVIEQQSILNFRFSNTEFLQVTTFQFSLGHEPLHFTVPHKLLEWRRDQ